LSPPDVIGGVIESREVVVINPIPLEENGVVLVGMSQSFRIEAIEDMVFQTR
jgi:hypothetical protein